MHHICLDSIPNLMRCMFNSVVSSDLVHYFILLCHVCFFFVFFYVALTADVFFSEEFISVYVGNLSPSTSVFDLEKVFQAFGRIKPDGVAIRSRKVSCLY